MRCKVISKVSPYRGNLVFCVQGATIRAPDGKEGARGQPSSMWLRSILLILVSDQVHKFNHSF